MDTPAWMKFVHEPLVFTTRTVDWNSSNEVMRLKPNAIIGYCERVRSYRSDPVEVIVHLITIPVPCLAMAMDIGGGDPSEGDCDYGMFVVNLKTRQYVSFACNMESDDSDSQTIYCNSRSITPQLIASFTGITPVLLFTDGAI